MSDVDRVRTAINAAVAAALTVLDAEDLNQAERLTACSYVAKTLEGLVRGLVPDGMAMNDEAMDNHMAEMAAAVNCAARNTRTPTASRHGGPRSTGAGG